MSEIFPEDNNHRNDPKSYNKTLLLTVIAAVLVSGLAVTAFIYLNKPKHGEQINAPSGLEEAIKQHFREELKERGISKTTYHYCEFIKIRDVVSPLRNYVALVEMYPTPTTELTKIDIDRYHKVFATEKGGKWDLISLPDVMPIFSVETHPCEK
jgi:hypothetical protein